MYNVYDRYFYLRHIVISKEHLQPYIWIVPSLFQEATCSDLVFSRVLCFFEISTCNHPCFQECWVNLPFQLQSLTHSTNGPFSIIIWQRNLTKPVSISKLTLVRISSSVRFINNIFDNLQSGCRKFFFTFMKKSMTLI